MEIDFLLIVLIIVIICGLLRLSWQNSLLLAAVSVLLYYIFGKTSNNETFIADSPAGARFPNHIIREQPEVRVPKSVLKIPTNADLYYKPKLAGDDGLVVKALHTGSMAQRAANNRSKLGKYSLMPYYDIEMEDNENREWWDNNDLAAFE